MGNWSISHEWQIEWIVGHGETLRTLVLDDCPIVTHVRNFGHFDEENYPVNPESDIGVLQRWKSDVTWSWVFSELEVGLSKLTRFVFGRGNWCRGRNFDFDGRVVVEWDRLARGEMMEYRAFDRGIGPCPWMDREDYVNHRSEDKEDEDNDEEDNKGEGDREDEDNDEEDNKEEGDREDEDSIDIEYSVTVGWDVQEREDMEAYKRLMDVVAMRARQVQS